MTLLKKIKMKKITSKNTKRALRKRNAKKSADRSDQATMFLL